MSDGGWFTLWALIFTTFITNVVWINLYFKLAATLAN